MRDRFTQQMEKLHVELIEMGALCEQAISRAYQVLMEEDPQAAQDLRKKMLPLMKRNGRLRADV